MPLENPPAAPVTPAAPAASASREPNWDAFASGADMNSAPPAEPRAPSPAPQSIASPSSQPTTAPPSPPAQPAPPDWRSRYQQRGVDVSRYQSEDDFYADVATYQRERPQLEQYAQIGAQLAPHAQRFAEFVAQQQGQPAPQQQPSEEVDPLEQAWGAPPYDPAWESQIIVDETTGEIRPRHALVPWQVVEGYKSYQEHRRQKALEFFNNPFKQTYQALEPKLKEAIRAEFQQLQQQHQAQTVLQQFEQQNAGWLYQADGSGQPLIHPATRQPVLSPLGLRFAQHVQILRNAGVTDQTTAAFLAANNLRAEMSAYAPPSAPPAQGNVPPRAPNGQFISPSALQQPAPAHQAPPATPEQVNQNRIGQFLTNAHQQAAYATPSFNGAPDPSNGNWAVRSERELDSRLSAALDRAVGAAN